MTALLGLFVPRPPGGLYALPFLSQHLAGAGSGTQAEKLGPTWLFLKGKPLGACHVQRGVRGSSQASARDLLTAVG